MDPESMRLDTKLIHAGEISPRIVGAVSLPVFQSSTFETESTAPSDYHDVRYMRLSNTPNHLVLGDKLARLENAEAGLVAASGMAAISSSLLTVLSAGDHLLVQATLYGGTHTLITRDLPTFGIEFDFVDAGDPASWQTRLRPTTRAFYVESITNPLMQVADLPAVVRFARKHGLVSMVDNTFPSPVNFRPPEHGFDISLHSCTKYLNGHTDIVAGAVIGRERLVREIKRRLDHLGGALDVHACFLLHRGLKTLGLRVRRQNANALTLARRFAEHPAVARVNYPGLETHADHARARELFDGFGGMLSLELAGGLAATRRLIDGLSIPIFAPSLGGVETLVTLPATTSHGGLSPKERAQLGISDGLLRVSVGVEAGEDLVEDFVRALDAARS